MYGAWRGGMCEHGARARCECMMPLPLLPKPNCQYHNHYQHTNTDGDYQRPKLVPVPTYAAARNTTLRLIFELTQTDVPDLTLIHGTRRNFMNEEEIDFLVEHNKKRFYLRP